MYKIYLPDSNKKLISYNLSYNNKLLEFVNDKSLELGTEKSKSFSSLDFLKTSESITRGTKMFYKSRIYKEEGQHISNYRHDFWNGETYDTEDYTLYTAFYNEQDIILKIINSLNPIKDILFNLASSDVICQNF